MVSSGSLLVLASFALFLGGVEGFASAFSSSKQQQQHYAEPTTRLMSMADDNTGELSRRSALVLSIGALAAVPSIASAAKPNGLILQTSESGLRWADAKIGSGESPRVGSFCSIDYSMASTVGRLPTVYSTKNGDAPYRWKLGDGTTIKGIEMAVLGSESEGIPPMKAGGIRRVIVPNTLGYNQLIQQTGKLSPTSNNKKCVANAEGSIGPIPPKEAPDGAYNRWYQMYCNPRIPYQPDLVLDIKLYGKRTTE